MVEEEGRKAGMSFKDAFTDAARPDPDEFVDPLYIDIDALEDEDEFWENHEKMKEAKQKQLELDELQRQSRLQLLGVIEQTADRESAIGQAAFAARQYLIFQEMTLETKKAMFNMLSDAQQAAVGASAGFLATAKAGFPKNIPLLIAYGIQVASLLSNVKKAMSNVKGGSGASAALQAPVAPSIAPPAEVNQIPEIAAAQPAIRAYVVQGDTRSAEEAEAKIQTRRTFGN